MIPMQSIDHLSPDERRALIEAAQAENDDLRQRLTDADKEIESLKRQLAEAQAGLAHQEQLIIRQRNVVLQQESLMDAIGAGGVSGQRITDDGALQALQACEKAYHRMIVGGTPQDCREHDAARVAFWRVFGGQS